MMKHLGTLLLGLAFVAVLRAQQPVTAGLPADLIGYYDRTTATGCPAGLAELTGARGAALVGLVSGGTKGSLVGSALTDLENRHHTHTIAHTHSLSAHTHTFSGTTGGPSTTVNVNDAGEGHDANTSVHTHTFSSTTGAPSSDVTGASSAANSGNESTVITPFIQLLFCKKS